MMNRKQKTTVAALVGVIGLASAYLFWPEVTPEGGPYVDPAQKAAGIFDKLTGKSSFFDDTWLDKRTVINGHPVPPVPDPKENNKTLAGIDTDRNGIRDDIDRAIAEIDWKNQAEYMAAQTHARTLQRLIENPTIQAGYDMWESVQCKPAETLHDFDVLGAKLEIIEKKYLNTPQRANVANAIAAKTSARIAPCAVNRNLK